MTVWVASFPFPLYSSISSWLSIPSHSAILALSCPVWDHRNPYETTEETGEKSQTLEKESILLESADGAKVKLRWCPKTGGSDFLTKKLQKIFYLRGLEQSQSQDEEWVVLKHWTKQKPDDWWLEIGRSAQRKSLLLNSKLTRWPGPSLSPFPIH